MPELRKDPIVGRWVIINTENARRPSEISRPDLTRPEGGTCPFCPGNEKLTPPEIMAYRDNCSTPNGPGWSLRVVPNRYPALRVEGTLDRVGVGLYDKMSGVGAHEVIIDTPEHGKDISDLDSARMEEVLWAYRERILDLKRDVRLKYVLIFKNQGRRAGAALEHSHSQLIALPIVPKTVIEEMEGAKRYFGYRDRCVYCDIVRQELQDKSRLVLENPDFMVIMPFAARFPFEMWLLPKRHDSSFENSQKHDFVLLSKIFSESLRRMNRALDHPDYNFFLHTSPFADLNNPYYHWHFEITPRVARTAGFERGTGFYINPTPPETAAAYLRDIGAGNGAKGGTP